METEGGRGVAGRNMEELIGVHPGLQSLEEWMRETKCDGIRQPLSKGMIDVGLDQMCRTCS